MEFESLKLSEINEYGTITGSNPVLTTKIINMYYIDEKGRLIYESCGMKSEVIGFDYDGYFDVMLLWE